MTDQAIYINTQDGSEATMAQHMAWTPDEEWSEAGYENIGDYFAHLISSGLLIRKDT